MYIKYTFNICISISMSLFLYYYKATCLYNHFYCYFYSPCFVLAE